MEHQTLGTQILRLIRHLSVAPIYVPIVTKLTMSEKQLLSRAKKTERRRKKIQQILNDIKGNLGQQKL